MRDKKATSSLDALIFLLAFVLIAMIMLFFFNMKTKGHTVDEAKEITGTNIFVIGLLRSDITYDEESMALSELISKHNLKQEKNYSDAIRNQIDSLMFQMYGKNICWKMTGTSWTIENGVKECEKLSKKESISSTVKIAGFNRESFDVKFETKT